MGVSGPFRLDGEGAAGDDRNRVLDVADGRNGPVGGAGFLSVHLRDFVDAGGPGRGRGARCDITGRTLHMLALGRARVANPFSTRPRRT